MVDVTRVGSRYQYPDTVDPTPPDSIPDRPLPKDPGFEIVPNPDGSEIGPLYVSDEGKQWIEHNVYDPGYVIDWGTRDIVDPNTGEVKGKVPTSVPKMV